MEAVQLHPNTDAATSYSVSNPAPPSALRFTKDVPIPRPTHPGELLVKVEATTIIRDSLTWPEIYDEQYKILGWDFAGTVVAVHENYGQTESFKVGDEVFGMVNAGRAGTWSQYAIVLEGEACLKPKGLTWAQAAAIPLSALTAYQALFEKAGLTFPDLTKSADVQTLRHSQDVAWNENILVTGALGGVGLYIVQLARLLNLHLVAATSSKARNGDFLEKLGADEVVEYSDLPKQGRRFRIIIDAVGGDVLKTCWSLVQDQGKIISIDSASYDFVEEHRKAGLTDGCEAVQALFFIVEPSNAHLTHLLAALEAHVLEPFVAAVLPLSDAAAAYEGSSNTPLGRGKVILSPWA